MRLSLDCADVCSATGALGSRWTGSNELVLKRMIETCAEACRVCREECEMHTIEHEYCYVCADACHECERFCRSVAETITPVNQ
jgi:hypothetical protein